MPPKAILKTKKIQPQGKKLMQTPLVRVLIFLSILFLLYFFGIFSLTKIFAIAAVVILIITSGFLFSRLPFFKFAVKRSEYKRLEAWIEERIGKAKGMSQSLFVDKLSDLYTREEKKIKNAKKIAGFKKYIEKNAYRHLFK